jgi:hypothetical protein
LLLDIPELRARLVLHRVNAGAGRDFMAVAGGFTEGVAEGFLEALWAEEFAHELSAPVGFFERWTLELSRQGALDPEDIDIAREESARLKALLVALRRVRPPELSRRPALLHQLAAAAVDTCQSLAKPRFEAVESIPLDLQVDVITSFGKDVLVPALLVMAGTLEPHRALEVRAEGSAASVVCSIHGGSLDGTFAESLPWVAETRIERDFAVARRIVRAHGGHILREEEHGAKVLRIGLALARHG